MESLKELNQICQKPRYREVGNWMVRHVERDAALPITWLLLHTAVTANQVTAVSLLVGLAGIWLFALPPQVFFLIGVMLMQLWYLLDHVDGQIARYRKTACLSGRFFDFVTHHLIHGVIPFSLGWYAYGVTNWTFFAIWGFAVSLSMTVFNLINDTKYKTFFEALSHGGKFRIIRGTKEIEAEREYGSREIPKKIFSLLHKLSEIHVLMNILTLAAILQVFLRISLDYRMALFLFYGFVIPLITTVKLVYLISRRKIDQEFGTAFERLGGSGE